MLCFVYLGDVIISVPFLISFFIFHKNHKNTLNDLFFHIFPPEKNFDIDTGDGGGAGGGTNKLHKSPKSSNKTPKTLKNLFFLYCFTLEGNFDIDAGYGGEGKSPKSSK